MRKTALTGAKASYFGGVGRDGPLGRPGRPPLQSQRRSACRDVPPYLFVVPFGLAPKWLRGFSLVEVTLALGIITFGLIAVMGLLPTGIKLAKQGTDEVAAVSIMTRISVSLEKAGTSAHSGNATFNADGVRIYTADGAAYAARWDIRSNSVPLTALITVSWPAITTNYTGCVESIVVMAQPPH